MAIRKFGTGEVLGVEGAEAEDLRKEAASKEWTSEAESDLADESQKGDDGLPR